jgi:hypothetical protein
MYAGLSYHYRNLPLVKAVKLITNDFNSRFAQQGLAMPGQFFLAITARSVQLVLKSHLSRSMIENNGQSCTRFGSGL